MRIACIHPAFTGAGGGERQILNLAIELGKKGHYVEIFTQYYDSSRCFPELIKRVKIKAVFPNTITRRSMEALAQNFEKNKLLFRLMLDVFRNYKDFINMAIMGLSIGRDFDIINCHNAPTQWAACIAKIKTRIPVVWTCNEPPFWFLHHSPFKALCLPLYELWDKLLVKKYVDKFITLDELNRERIKNIYCRKSSLIRSGIDHALFQDNGAGTVRDTYHIKDDDYILLQVGTLAGYKRQADSLAALKALKDKENIKLVLVGESPKPEKERLEDFAKDLGVSGKVIFAGKVTEDDLSKFYNTADILLFPAEQTWGLAVTEAMACSKPVIVTRSCGVAEIIEDGVNGFLVSPRSPEEISNKIRLLMSDANLSRSMGESAAKFVRENFSWEKSAKDYIRIFEDVLRG